jgi:putative addiction module CopG family antidote
MWTFDLPMSESMREFIEEEVRSGRFSSASEFVQSLIREEQKRVGKEYGAASSAATGHGAASSAATGPTV